jgi:hypothetical protein
MVALWVSQGYPEAAAQAMVQGHGAAARGLTQAARGRQGRFGFMFPELPPASFPEDLLLELASQAPPLGMRDPAPGNGATDNRGIPAGFTFLSQFTDHDLTLDKTPLAQAQADPGATTNFRQAQLNLDSVYDGAPRNGAKLLLQLPNPFGVVDVPRGADGSAIIADARNDENLNLLPIHLGFMRFHNALVDRGLSFEAAQEQTRFHYQWVLTTEWLPLIVGQAAVDEVADIRPGKQSHARTRFYKPGNPNKPMMPVEFAVACFRMGHSMVRNNYNIQRGRRLAILQPVLANPLGSLNGGRQVPRELEQQNDLFFRAPTSPPLDPPGASANDQSFNLSRQLDSQVSPNLLSLPLSAIGGGRPGDQVNLAARNLTRAVQVGLPSGQDVARALGVPVLSNADLGLSARYGGKAPLWFYVLKEAELTQAGARMGPTGGRVIAEVIAGLLDADKTSFFNQPRGFTPLTTPFTMADLLRVGGSLA